jgi:hypothetical protein
MKAPARATERLVELARQDPQFLGCALSRYQQAQDLNAAQLAAWLGCGPGGLTRLSLCRAPDQRSAGFAADVLRIARFAACNPDRLMRVLR